MNLISKIQEAKQFIRDWPQNPTAVDYQAAQKIAIGLRTEMNTPLTVTPTGLLSDEEKVLARGRIEMASSALRELQAAIGMR